MENAKMAVKKLSLCKIASSFFLFFSHFHLAA